MGISQAPEFVTSFPRPPTPLSIATTMSLETELTMDLPAYEQLPATRRLIDILQDRKAVELGNLLQYVVNLQTYLSSSRADDGMITGIMEMCSEEFSQLMVQKRFGIDAKEWDAYEAFVTEVTSALKRKGESLMHLYPSLTYA